MGPNHGLPLPNGYHDDEEYVKDLTEFIKSSDLLQLLCGGVHILDFFTREPDLYECLLPAEWRAFFDLHDLEDLLDLFLREDVSNFTTGTSWRGQNPPPPTLSLYIANIRRLALQRDYSRDGLPVSPQDPTGEHAVGSIPRQIAVGMKEKKIHEVDNFAHYVNGLIEDVEARTGRKITHLVDFGSGQNYLGRTLASAPYNRHVIAVEGRHANVEGAKSMDIHAKLASKTIIWRNKKEWRAHLALQNGQPGSKGGISQADSPPKQSTEVEHTALEGEGTKAGFTEISKPARAILSQNNSDGGSIQYVEHQLEDGRLEAVIEEAMVDCTEDSTLETNKNDGSQPAKPSAAPNLMVISLHSCGNLTHHGIRSLVLNPSVSAIALVGCCYNLLTERLTPPTYKLPNLRPTAANAPTAQDKEQGDPHGFPMSTRIEATKIPLNITARMMAVQAPYNWSKADSARFFTRHFYRALLQKIFLDKGVIEPPSGTDRVTDTPQKDRAQLLEEMTRGETSNVARIPGGATQPVIIGSLRKSCYTDFKSYVHGAVAKLSAGTGASVGETKDGRRDERAKDVTPAARIAELVCERMRPTHLSDAEIDAYEARFANRRKHLSIVWSLMAYSATLVEALIVVDRWLWLREQMVAGEDAGSEGRVRWAWVRSVFEYRWSPRNLVVVGIKE